MTRGIEQIRSLQKPEFERLWTRARQRLEREPDAVMTARVRFKDLTEPERKAIGGLIGRRLPGPSASIPLGTIDQILREGPAAIGLVEFLATVGGPLRDRPAESQAERAAMNAHVEALRATRFAAEAWFQGWLDELVDRGRLLKLVREGENDVVRRAATVFDALPAKEVPIALFASAVLGSAKALDRTPLDRFVLHGLARRAGVEAHSGADRRRWLWERVGVIPDDLASQVLVLNLRPLSGEPLAGWLRTAADVGLPVRVTLHQLARCTLVFGEGPVVHICENPAVLRAAAEQLGPRCRPLICTEGRPGMAFWRMTSALGAAGTRFAVRADFDGPGLSIVDEILRRTAASPWRFDATTYAAAAERTDRALSARPLGDTPWDPELGRAMAERRRFVEEEELITSLLADLVHV